MAGAPSNLIEWLGSGTGGAELLGGKGASLDHLLKLGFRVPPGFCLTTAAFPARMASDGAQGPDTEDGRPSLDPEVDEELARALEALVAQLAAKGMADPRFAVRSSAIGEDGALASYAGLHETELDVRPAEVPAAVRRCWASLRSPIATAYRARKGLPDDDLAMAVVVQALVPADAAAVAFTRHPVTGGEDRLVITAVRGLGDAMVAGTVTPDTYEIDRSTRSVASFQPGDAGEQALDASELAALVELALRVEALFGGPVDIEAAIAAGEWSLLQARPITTGAPALVAQEAGR
jgi:phosphoenolpyruvate synthase/pyruvate phosphate dikinase